MHWVLLTFFLVCNLTYLLESLGPTIRVIHVGVSLHILALILSVRLKLTDLHLHLPILLHQLLYFGNRYTSLLQSLIFLLQRHEFYVNIVAVQALPLQVEQLLQVQHFFLQFKHHVWVHSIELHWLHFHDYLHYPSFTCRALYTNFSVFMVSSRLVLEGEIFPIMKV